MAMVYPVESRHPLYFSASVTDVPCPCCATGTVRWHEAGFVPGYRKCDGCGREFLATGDATHPRLEVVED